MLNIDITRAWKDEDYFGSLSEEQLSQLPDNPAGIIELSDADMEIVAGGGDMSVGQVGCPTSLAEGGCSSFACDAPAVPSEPSEPSEPSCPLPTWLCELKYSKGSKG